jgi:hypothetical protein
VETVTYLSEYSHPKLILDEISELTFCLIAHSGPRYSPHFPKKSDFYCRVCHQRAPRVENIQHVERCPVPKIRAAIREAKSEDAADGEGSE